VNELWTEAAGLSGLANDGIHTAIDSNASVPGTFEGLLGKPMISVPAPQDLYQAGIEFFQLGFADV